MATQNNITKAQGAQIRSLMKEDRWDAIVRFVSLKIETWNNEDVNGNDAFQTLRALHMRDGKVAGVREVFDQMERQAFE